MAEIRKNIEMLMEELKESFDYNKQMLLFHYINRYNEMLKRVKEEK